MTSARELVAATFAAARIMSPTSFSWFGRPSSPAGADGWAPEIARAFLGHLLQLELYAHVYCQGGPVPAIERPAWWTPRRSTAFSAALSAANAGTGSWDPGWTVAGRENGHLVVRRDGLSLWIDPAEARGDAGETVRVRLPKELFKLSPGFYMALGDEGIALDDPPPLVRLYWHVGPRGAATLVGELTGRLNAAGLPFRFKVVAEPAHYDRCDAGVLYLRAADYGAAEPAIEAVYAAVRDGLDPVTPAFTKPLAPGLAVAEDPGSGESFGMSRADLLARALIAAHEAGVGDRDGQLEVAASVFAAAGLDLDRPHLGPGALDRYRALAP